MGKKVKTGKARQDKFYQLAKESGFRARSAFKLLQLNRRFQFLEKARVCIDLCAAPGGWLQVVQQHMPMSSLIIGVDLVPIKPLNNIVTFQSDITSDLCRAQLKKELQQWKADVVLHDGAPNVGKNWLYDAFQQTVLTLEALKLATEVLRKGGWFVSKVFRSKDYHALIWVLKQLFKRVHASKPQASRNESAEIFVVCQQYIAPDKLDPKFLDPKYVFDEIAEKTKASINNLLPKKKTKAEGYDETDTSFHHKLLASKYISASNHIQLLTSSHEIVMDTDEIKNHPLTTPEIVHSCADIKVLGKRELRKIIRWRLKLSIELEEKEKGKTDETDKMEEEKDSEAEEDIALSKIIEDQKTETAKALKKKRKQVMREKRRLRDKMGLAMVHPGDKMTEDDLELFQIKGIKSKEELDNIVNKPKMIVEPEPVVSPRVTQKVVSYNKFEPAPDLFEHSHDYPSEEELSDVEEEMEFEEQLAEAEENPLLFHMDSRDIRQMKDTENWFNRDVFSTAEGDENLEISEMTAEFKKKGGVVLDESIKKAKKAEVDTKFGMDEDMDSDDDGDDAGDDDAGEDDDNTGSDVESESGDDEQPGDSDSDYDVHESLQRVLMQQKRGDKMKKSKANKSGFEEVPASAPVKTIKLTPLELALGEQMIKTSKTRREIEELSYNRYTRGDEDLPDWFAADEARHSRKQLPVTKEQVQYYKDRQRAIDARPIKKVAEAQAKKKRRMMNKLEKVRKKAANITDSTDITEAEKWRQIKDMYKKAGLLNKKKREVTYVIAKKGGGRKTIRPNGVKGFYKVVDKRLKNDKKHDAMKEKKGKKRHRVRK